MRTLLVYADFDWLPSPTFTAVNLATNPCVHGQLQLPLQRGVATSARRAIPEY